MFIHARSAVKSLQNTLVTASTFTSVIRDSTGFWGRGARTQASVFFGEYKN